MNKGETTLVVENRRLHSLTSNRRRGSELLPTFALFSAGSLVRVLLIVFNAKDSNVRKPDKMIAALFQKAAMSSHGGYGSTLCCPFLYCFYFRPTRSLSSRDLLPSGG